MVSGESFHIAPYKIGDSIDHWIESLEDYIVALVGDNCSAPRKLAIMKTTIGDEAMTAIKNFSSGEKNTFDNLKKKLLEYYKPSMNTSTYRHTFYNTYQEEGEHVEDFVNRLLELATKCQFKFLCDSEADPPVHHDRTSQFVRDRLIVGLFEDSTRARLMREKNLTLENAIQIAKTAEAAKEQLKQTARSHMTASVNSLQKRKNRNYGPQKKSTHSQQNGQFNKDKRDQSVSKCCKYCGKTHAKGTSNCPAYGKECKSCGKRNHFAKVCRQKKVHELERPAHYYAEYYAENEPTEQQFDIGLVVKTESRDEQSNVKFENLRENKSVDQIETRDWCVDLIFGNSCLNVKIDSGAQANVISLENVNKVLPKPIILPTKITLSAFGGFNLPVIGKIFVNCRRKCENSESQKLEFIVVKSKVKTVLGLDSSIKLKFIDMSQVKAHAITDITKPVSDAPEKKKISQARPGANITSQDNSLNTLISEFSDVFDNSSVGLIKDCEYDIKLADNSIPKISRNRPTPFAKKPKIEAELERMVKLDIIEPVEEPTEWVNNYVAVEKGDKTRICLDPNALNQYVLRERIQLPTIDDVYSDIRDGKLYSKLDLKDGYWQVPLSQKSSSLTTFQTHVGRFKYKRLPFGLNSANEVFQKKVYQVFGDLEGVKVMYDDVLVYGATKEQHNSRLRKALDRARKFGVKLNRNKCEFMLSEVTYIGHVISAQGIKVDQDKVVDLLNMPAPEDKKGIQRLLGSLNFFARYIPNMSTITHPLRELLGKNTPFHWTQTHDHALNQIKKILASAPVLEYYDVNKPVILEADASSVGLGAVILQEGKPIAYGSRSLTTTQTHYAQIEKELLAIVFGCERFRQYLYGKAVTVHTDHKPLINTINKPLLDNPKRIQRLLLRLQCYNLTLKYVPGKDLHVPDMLSRACSVTSKPSVSEKLLTDEADYQVHVVIEDLKCSDKMRVKIKQEILNDAELKQVEYYIKNGWPEYRSNCNELAKLYWPHRADLCVYDGFIIFHDRIVIPSVLRAEILERLHNGHQGRERCKRLARSAVFWPHINRDIDSTVDKCHQCLSCRNSPPREALRPHLIPNRAWQKVGIDLFSFGGKRYQIIVDYFSKWIEVAQVPMKAVSFDVIKHLHDVFTRFGYPETIMSDGDPLYTSSKFKTYCLKKEISHIYSSSRYPQSNGQSERSIQHIKNMLRKCIIDGSDFKDALLMYRNTPLSSSLNSPAMLFFSRNLRTNVPVLELNSDSDAKNKVFLESRQCKSAEFYNRHVRNDCREVFKPGDLVQYKNSNADRAWQPGQVAKVRSERSYTIVNKFGNLVNRNRKMILPDKASKEMKYDLNLPEGSDNVSTENVCSTSNLNQVATPLQTPPPPPLRRSQRTVKRPQFYGNPVQH